MNKLGGWSEFKKVTAVELAIFEKAMRGFVGVDYEPLNVSEQVVSGKNYMFFCNATTVTREPQKFNALVTISAPLSGDPEITEIKRI